MRSRAGRPCGRSDHGGSAGTRRRHSSSAPPSRRVTWKGSITVTKSGSSSTAAVLKPVNPSIATTSIPSRQASSRSLSRVLKTCLERPSTMSSRRAPGSIADRREVDDDGDVPVTAARMPPDLLVDPDYLDPVEAVLIIDQD